MSSKTSVDTSQEIIADKSHERVKQGDRIRRIGTTGATVDGAVQELAGELRSER